MNIQDYGIITAGSAITPAEANTQLELAYDKQDHIMHSMDVDEKVFYVDRQVYEVYYKYLIEKHGTAKPPILFNGMEMKIL